MDRPGGRFDLTFAYRLARVGIGPAHQNLKILRFRWGTNRSYCSFGFLDPRSRGLRLQINWAVDSGVPGHRPDPYPLASKAKRTHGTVRLTAPRGGESLWGLLGSPGGPLGSPGDLLGVSWGLLGSPGGLLGISPRMIQWEVPGGGRYAIRLALTKRQKV